MSKQVLRLTESELHKIIKESVKITLNEISSDVLDRASDKAESLGRKKQMQNFKDGAFERRKDELTKNGKFDPSISMYFRAHRDFIDIHNNDLRLQINSNGNVKSYEKNVQYGNPDMMLVSWPLEYEHRLHFRDKNLNRQLAMVIVKWCDKYLSPEGKEKLQGFDDWHNWVQL